VNCCKQLESKGFPK